MKFQSFRSAVVFASVIVGSVIPSQAFAQIDVLTGGNQTATYGDMTSTYKFTGSMILNSIGFVTNGITPQSLSYSLKGTTFNFGTDFFAGDLSTATDGIQWLNITPQSMVINDVVTVYTRGASTAVGNPASPDYVDYTYIRENFTVNSLANVSYEGLVASNFGPGSDTAYTNSNIRVTNPGSNVAPEPGSLALALTGGCALLGMVIRRRKIN